MFDDRTVLARQVAADLREFFGGEVFKTVIPRSIRLAEAPSFGKTNPELRPPLAGARKLTLSWPRRYSRMSKASDNPRKALGKGLSALLGPKPRRRRTPEPQETAEEVLQVPVDQIDPNPLQSRTVFQAERLAGTRAVHQGERRDPTPGGPRERGALPVGGRRAALARLEDSRAWPRSRSSFRSSRTSNSWK